MFELKNSKIWYNIPILITNGPALLDIAGTVTTLERKCSMVEYTTDFISRFWSKVNKTDTCWLWNASTDGQGYGKLRVGKKFMPAHIFAYEAEEGAVPEGLELDHLCRVRLCVRPSHLEIVTHKVNCQRRSLHNRKRFCKNGHELTLENLYTHTHYRECRKCRTINTREYMRKRRAQKKIGAFSGT
jgi:hypothetical protein